MGFRRKCAEASRCGGKRGFESSMATFCAASEHQRKRLLQIKLCLDFHLFVLLRNDSEWLQMKRPGGLWANAEWICRVEWEGNCLSPSMRLLWKWSAHFGADGELTRSGGWRERQTVDVLCFSALFHSSAWENREEHDECWLTASGADDERLIHLCWPPAGFLPLMCPGHLCGVRAQPTGELIHSRFTQINNVPPALCELLNAVYVAPPGKDSPQRQDVPWPPSVPSCLL